MIFSEISRRSEISEFDKRIVEAIMGVHALNINLSMLAFGNSQLQWKLLFILVLFAHAIFRKREVGRVVGDNVRDFAMELKNLFKME